MKLYIKLFSMIKFKSLYDNNEYLQKILSETDSNMYYIETDDLRDLNRILVSNGIKYEIKD